MKRCMTERSWRSAEGSHSTCPLTRAILSARSALQARVKDQPAVLVVDGDLAEAAEDIGAEQPRRALAAGAGELERRDRHGGQPHPADRPVAQVGLLAVRGARDAAEQ